jgi:hypothetical protein
MYIGEPPICRVCGILKHAGVIMQGVIVDVDPLNPSTRRKYISEGKKKPGEEKR